MRTRWTGLVTAALWRLARKTAAAWGWYGPASEPQADGGIFTPTEAGKVRR